VRKWWTHGKMRRWRHGLTSVCLVVALRFSVLMQSCMLPAAANPSGSEDTRCLEGRGTEDQTCQLHASGISAGSTAMLPGDSVLAGGEDSEKKANGRPRRRPSSADIMSPLLAIAWLFCHLMFESNRPGARQSRQHVGDRPVEPTMAATEAARQEMENDEVSFLFTVASLSSMCPAAA